MHIQAVLFDLDFTLARPGPELGPDGFSRIGSRFGLNLDPARYEAARASALQQLQRHPDLVHDEEIWIAFTERVVRGMGGDSERARECAIELERGWARSENFDLYDDVLPVLDELRAHGLKIGLISNGARNLDEFVRDHKLVVDVAVGSRAHGLTKPHPSIFQVALRELDVAASSAAMVGDSPEDDIEGARALGMRGFLLDRLDQFPDHESRLTDLRQLPAALGLGPSRAGL